MKNFRFSWFIGGSLVALVLAGLFFDVWRSYAVRKSLDRDIREIASNCAKYLPFRPKEAVQYGLAALESKGIKPDPGSVSVSADGYQVKVSVVSDVVAYFAWIVGNPRMKFQSECQAEVVLVGSGPVAEIQGKEQVFAVIAYPEFALRTNVNISPAGAPNVQDYALKGWSLVSAPTYKIGDTVTMQPISDFAYLKDYASPTLMTVVILSGVQDDHARVQGFAALSFEGVNGEGQVAGRFIRAQAQGAPKGFLPEENNFGYVQGGTPRVTLK